MKADFIEIEAEVLQPKLPELYRKSTGVAIQTAEFYLIRWGDYMRFDKCNGLGYPSNGNNPADLSQDEPEGVRIMQNIFRTMSRERQVIARIEYIECLPLKQKLAVLNIKDTRYRASLNDLKAYVQGRLDSSPETIDIRA